MSKGPAVSPGPDIDSTVSGDLDIPVALGDEEGDAWLDMGNTELESTTLPADTPLDMEDVVDLAAPDLLDILSDKPLVGGDRVDADDEKRPEGPDGSSAKRPRAAPTAETFIW